MAVEGEVGAARITFGAATGEQAGGVEDLEVVREQVGWDREGGPQLGRGPVADGEQVDDAQACDVGEGAMKSGPSLQNLCLLSVH